MVKSTKKTRTSNGPKPGFWGDLLGRLLYFWWQVVLLIIVGGFAFAGAAWGGYALISRHVKATEVRVPGLLGYRVEQAVEALHDNGTELAIQIEDQRYSNEADAGEILSQRPGADTFAKSGSIVRVVISRGTSRVECPDIKGVEYLDAGIRLREKDLVEGRKSFVFSNSVESDLVISQTPPAGEPLLRGSAVHMLVSLGAKADQYLMPNVLDMPLAGARGFLMNAGFGDLKVQEAAFPGKMSGVVFRTEPAPGAIVGLDTEILLTVVK